jgi:hypothetical protein
MKYFLGFLGVVALVVLVFILVIRGFSGSGDKQPKTESQLSDYTNTTTVMRMTIEGPVVADQNYDEVRITIGRDANTIEIVNGYQDKVISAKTYPNNSDAYGNFLRAIQLLGYTKGDTTGTLDDERGYCASGNRYVYEIVSGASDVQRYWIGTCGVGTFKGSSAQIRALFRAQIPDYANITGKLTIGG